MLTIRKKTFKKIAGYSNLTRYSATCDQIKLGSASLLT